MNDILESLAMQSKEYATGYADAHDAIWFQKYNEKFAELIIKECIAQCDQVADAAKAISNSDFVTESGHMLHEGMWGGAKGCTSRIMNHFGLDQ